MNEFVHSLCSLSKMLSTKTLKCLLWIQRCKRRRTSCIVHRVLLFVCFFSFSPSFDPLSSPLHIMHDSDGDQATTAGVATIAVTLPLLIVLASVAIFVYKRKQGQTS